MLRLSFFSYSAVNGESHREVYSYVDQLPVSEIIHQVRLPSRQQAPFTQSYNSVFVLCVFGGWTFFVLSLWMQCGSHFFYLLIFLSVSVLDLDSEQKVRCNIHQQMSLCRFHSDSIRRETLLPLGLGAAKPP